MVEALVQDWLEEYSTITEDELTTFAAQHQHNHEVAGAVFAILQNYAKYLELTEQICDQLFGFYRSTYKELKLFSLQFLPSLIYLYLNAVVKGEKGKCRSVETFLISVYNLEILDENGQPRVISFRMPFLAQHSIYHEAKGLAQTDLRRWEECSTKTVNWGPLPHIEVLYAQNRLKVMTALLFIYNRYLSLLPKASLHHLCKAATMLTTQGFSRYPLRQTTNIQSKHSVHSNHSNHINSLSNHSNSMSNHTSSSNSSATSNTNKSQSYMIDRNNPRIPMSGQFLLELLHAVYFAMFNEFASMATSTVEDIHRRAVFELYSDVILVTNAIRHSLAVNPSGQPCDGPMGISCAISTATTTVSVSKSMITNASFRTKKLPDDLEFDFDTMLLPPNTRNFQQMSRDDQHIHELDSGKSHSADNSSNNRLQNRRKSELSDRILTKDYKSSGVGSFLKSQKRKTWNWYNSNSLNSGSNKSGTKDNSIEEEGALQDEDETTLDLTNKDKLSFDELRLKLKFKNRDAAKTGTNKNYSIEEQDESVLSDTGAADVVASGKLSLDERLKLKLKKCDLVGSKSGINKIADGNIANKSDNRSDFKSFVIDEKTKISCTDEKFQSHSSSSDEILKSNVNANIPCSDEEKSRLSSSDEQTAFLNKRTDDRNDAMMGSPVYANIFEMSLLKNSKNGIVAKNRAQIVDSFCLEKAGKHQNSDKTSDVSVVIVPNQNTSSGDKSCGHNMLTTKDYNIDDDKYRNSDLELGLIKIQTHTNDSFKPSQTDFEVKNELKRQNSFKSPNQSVKIYDNIDEKRSTTRNLQISPTHKPLEAISADEKTSNETLATNSDENTTKHMRQSETFDTDFRSCTTTSSNSDENFATSPEEKSQHKPPVPVMLAGSVKKSLSNCEIPKSENTSRPFDGNSESSSSSDTYASSEERLQSLMDVHDRHNTSNKNYSMSGDSNNGGSILNMSMPICDQEDDDNNQRRQESQTLENSESDE